MNKSRFFTWIFLLLVTCCACNNPANNSKSELLPMDSVVTLVADCYFVESEIYVKQWKIDVNELAAFKYDSLFEKHGISKEKFVEDLKYYVTNKKLADVFMEKVDTAIERRVAAIRESLELEP